MTNPSSGRPAAIVIALSLFLSGLARADALDPKQVADFFDSAFAIERHEHEIVGAVVSVVQNDALVFEKGYGYADLERRVPADPEQSLFRIASISKTFVWTAVMQLVEEGRLDLDADISGYLDFDVPATFEQPIRLRDLMTHSAGFEDAVIGTFKRTLAEVPPLGVALKSTMPRRVQPPGKYSAYSNYGTALAGYIVERVSGKPWYEVVEDRILTPLAMTSTSPRQPLPDALATRRAIGYKWRDGRFVPQPFMFEVQTPAGVISTTAADMARYMRAHLAFGVLDGKRILKEETAREMQSELFRHAPQVNPFLHGFYRSDRNGILIFGHGGDVNQFHSDMSLFPQHDLGVFVSFNSDPGAESRANVVAGFIDRFFPVEMPPALKPALDRAKLADYVGNWAPMRRNYSSLERIGVLLQAFTISPTDDGELRMAANGKVARWVPIGPDLFRARYDERTLVFERGTDGRVAHAFMSSNPTSALERLAWYESPKLHTRLFGFVGVVSLLAVLGWSLRAFSRAPEPARLPRLHVATAYVAALLTLVTLAGLVKGLTDDSDELAYGLPRYIAATMMLDRVAAALALPIVAFAALQLVGRLGSAASRVRYAIVAAATVVFAWQSWFWNFI